MYTVSKGPSKLVAKTRRTLPSHLERIDTIRDTSKRLPEIDAEDMSVSKPVFLQISEQKLSNMKTYHDNLSPEHKELVKFVSESWNSVTCKDCKPDSEYSSSSSGSSTVTYYKSNKDKNCLPDFVPFDLETWWGKQIFNTITKSVN